MSKETRAPQGKMPALALKYRYFIWACNVQFSDPERTTSNKNTRFRLRQTDAPHEPESFGRGGLFLFAPVRPRAQTFFPLFGRFSSNGPMIQEPIFCGYCNTDFEGGGDGRGCGMRYFFGQIGPAQPHSELTTPD